jgi:P-type Mg2+ transporter
MPQEEKAFWSIEIDDLLASLHTSREGLSSGEALRRLEEYGPNTISREKSRGAFSIFIAQFKNAIILLLLFATAVSFYLEDRTDALIILFIILVSAILGFIQERGAENAMKSLLAIVRVRSTLLRDGSVREIEITGVVPGDIVILHAGDVIPADCVILEANELHADESLLTGESFPAEKLPGAVPPDAPLARRRNVLWMGTHVMAGGGKAVAVKTDRSTEFGKISDRIRLRPAETDFEHGIRRFGYLLMEITLTMLLVIFAFNVYLNRPVMDSFLFSMALAVGLTPQLLPAIITINLAQGAKNMAKSKVIVKHLPAIENFGSMNVLCSDKTGTITEGKIRLKASVSIDGKPSEKVQLYACLNSVFQSNYANPIDQALREAGKFDLSGWQKLDEVPYDFLRRRLSVLASHKGSNILVTKGALMHVADVCAKAESPSGEMIDMAREKDGIQKLGNDLNDQGFRTLGVAYRDMGAASTAHRDDEGSMVFLGIIALYDPPKENIAEIFTELKSLGVSLKIVTGDTARVAASIHRQLGLPEPVIITGGELHGLTDGAYLSRIPRADVFAEVEPNQKEHIILALKKAGNVVGYMGDGINDAPALHASDVGISVESAADVAKSAAEIVLMEKDLAVLIQGVKEGRKTFANTLKYVFMATSANFGNMFSMAGASLFLPFLPLLPKQILLTNLLTDFPEMTIATDTVDEVMIENPHRWDIGFIRKFMLVFGILSSVFDYCTFGVLLLLLKADPGLFRSGWFVESVASAALIVLVVRTRKTFFKSRPSSKILIATCAVVAAALLIPYSPLATLIGFKPLPLKFLLWLTLIILAYVLSAEVVKKVFYRLVKY